MLIILLLLSSVLLLLLPLSVCYERCFAIPISIIAIATTAIAATTDLISPIPKRNTPHHFTSVHNHFAPNAVVECRAVFYDAVQYQCQSLSQHIRM